MGRGARGVGVRGAALCGCTGCFDGSGWAARGGGTLDGDGTGGGLLERSGGFALVQGGFDGHGGAVLVGGAVGFADEFKRPGFEVYLCSLCGAHEGGSLE